MNVVALELVYLKPYIKIPLLYFGRYIHLTINEPILDCYKPVHYLRTIHMRILDPPSYNR